MTATPAPDAAHARLVRHLLDHSVRTGDFVLKSGRRSSWFIDSKQTACRPEGILAVADVALPQLPDDVTAVGGPTMGADPVAFGLAAVAATRGRPLRSFSVRKEAKGYATGGRVAGALEPGDRVVIVEDTTTRGSSSLDAVAAVREAGAEPVLVMAVVDRGGTCAEWCRRVGLPFLALVTAPQLGFDYEGGAGPDDAADGGPGAARAGEPGSGAGGGGGAASGSADSGGSGRPGGGASADGA